MANASLCSLENEAADLPAWGTAKHADVIVAVEIAGSWGAKVVGSSGLREPKGAVLYAIRRPGRHARTPQRPTVLISGGFGDVPWLVEGTMAGERIPEFLASDVTDPTTWDKFGLAPSTDAALLVCTNGRRDACCAVRGRPVALAAAESANGERVWEVSHIGGHKLAPTGIHLPSGQTFGRMSDVDGVTLASVGRSGSLPNELFSADKHRGRVDLSPAQQVAETYWRNETGRTALLPPVAIGDTQKGRSGTSVELPDGRRVVVTQHDGPMVRDSCAKAPKRSSYFEVDVLPEASSPSS